MIANIAFSIAAKLLQAVLGFAIVHHLIATWGPARYGIWATMTSVIAYAALFDFGVGYGIKNKIAEAHARGRLEEAEAHARFGVLFYLSAGSVLLVIGALVIREVSPFREHVLAAGLLWLGFVANFVLSFANVVLQALGKFRMLSATALIVPAAWYSYLCLGGDATTSSLAIGAAVYAALLVVQGGALVAVVSKNWSFKWLDRLTESRRLGRSLVATGGKFFVLQVTSLVLFYSGNLLTFQFLGAEQTARYDATMKVFSLFSVGFSLVVSIAWTEISKAKSSMNQARLRHILYGLITCSLGICVAAAGMAWWAPVLVAKLTNVHIARAEAVPFALLAAVQATAFSGAVYLNAFELLTGQVILGVASIPVFFVMALVFFDAQLGIGTVALASAIATSPALVYSLWSAWRIVHPATPRAAWLPT